MAIAFIFTGMAQQMPSNPDANGDDFVGVDDVLGVIGVYDTALMQPGSWPAMSQNFRLIPFWHEAE